MAENEEDSKFAQKLAEESASSMDDVRWHVIDPFMETNYLRWKTDAFNKMMTECLFKILSERYPLVVFSPQVGQWHVLEIQDWFLTKPLIRDESDTNRLRPLYIDECRARSYTAMSPVFAYMVHSIYTVKDSFVEVMRKEMSSKEQHVNYETIEMVQTRGVLDKVYSYESLPYCLIPIFIGSILCHTYHSTDLKALNKECKYDTGGYFVVKGQEKMLMIPDRPMYNKPFVHEIKKPGGAYRYEATVWSEHTQRFRSTSTFHMYYMEPNKTSAYPTLHVGLPFLSLTVPLVLLFRVLDKNDIGELISIFKHMAKSKWSPAMEKSVVESMALHPQIRTREQALQYIFDHTPKKKIKDIVMVERNIHRELYPHLAEIVAPEKLTEAKVKYLCWVGAKLLYKVARHELYYKSAINPDISKSEMTDRDCYTNKAIKTPIELLTLMIRAKSDEFVSLIRRSILERLEHKKPLNLLDCLKMDCISGGLQSAIATGNWQISKRSHDMAGQTGISQPRDCLNYNATLSQQTKLIRPQHKETKQMRPRFYHRSGLGTLCLSETPDGPLCGVVRALALLTVVSLGTKPDAVAMLLIREGYLDDTYFKPPVYQFKPKFEKEKQEQLTRIKEERQKNSNKKTAIVLLNGAQIGETTDPEAIVERVRLARRQLELSPEIGVSYELTRHESALVGGTPKLVIDEISIRTSAGRILRPLLLPKGYECLLKHQAMLDKLHKPLTWIDLLRGGIVELLDREEESQAWIHFPDIMDQITKLQ